jgi:putative salt-induced outer membrane protein YdiY
LKTTYAGEVKIDWKDIKEITSKAPVKVQTLDGSGVWGITLNTALILERLIFFHRQQGFYDFNAPNAWRLRADQGFRVPVYKQFAMNLEYDLRYDSNPAPGRKQTDHLYIIGVSYVLPE